jgi:cardiolipin synthase
MVFTGVEAWAIFYLAFEWAIRLAMVVIVPLRRSPEAARSWLLLVFFLPIPALLIYRLLGRPTYPRWRRERFLKLPKILAAASKEIAHSRFCRRPDLPRNLVGPALLIEKLGQFPTLAGNDVELLSEYDDVIDRLIADIEEAQQTVHLLFYIFADDETGRRVMDALDRAARRGVKCRVLIDAIGSRPWAQRVAKQLTPPAWKFGSPYGWEFSDAGRHAQICAIIARLPSSTAVSATWDPKTSPMPIFAGVS